MRSLLFKVSLLAVAGTLLLTGQGLSGNRAPSFSLPDAGFQQHDLLDYRGRWLLLFFVRTEDPVSKTIAQMLEARKGKAGLLIVGVSPIENQGTIAKFVADAKISSSVVFDQGQAAASYFRATPAKPNIDLPHLFAISPNGTITNDWAGAGMKDPAFGAQLDAVLQSSGAKK
jgi:peroxiredoxin